MGRRAAALLLCAVLGLLAVGVGLSWRLLRGLEAAAQLASTERLQAMGTTAAAALRSGASPALLAALQREGQLEDAYLLDGALRPLARPAGAPSLLRVDPDRAAAAQGGRASVGAAYRLDAPELAEGRAENEGVDDGARGTEILAGYFPVPGDRVLVLEAGAAFVDAPRRLRTAAWVATVLGAVLTLLFSLTVLLAVRAAARERRLVVQAERGRAVSQMAAMAAHEIRNPLGTIRAGAELIREQPGANEEARAIIGDIVSEVDRLNRLVDELLSLSRELPITARPLDLGALCDDVCQALRRRFPDDALHIERAGERQVALCADEDRLRQVLLNLGLNAVHAMEGRGNLELRLDRRGAGAQVVVSDDGPGVDEQLSRRLFEPFVSGKAGGTGLGLVLSRRIAERHGGSLELLPTPPGRRGARFVIELPRRPPPG